jgi:hypothetical protein
MDIIFHSGGVLLVNRSRKPSLVGRPPATPELCDVNLNLDELEQIIVTLNKEKHRFIEDTIEKSQTGNSICR